MTKKRKYTSAVPFMDPTQTRHDRYVWVFEDGRSVVKFKNRDDVSVLDDSGEVLLTLTGFRAALQGENLYQNASSESEKNWAKALCSAALL